MFGQEYRAACLLACAEVSRRCTRHLPRTVFSVGPRPSRLEIHTFVGAAREVGAAEDDIAAEETISLSKCRVYQATGTEIDGLGLFRGMGSTFFKRRKKSW